MKKVHNWPLSRLARLREERPCFPPIFLLCRPTSLSLRDTRGFALASEKEQAFRFCRCFLLLCTPSKPSPVRDHFDKYSFRFPLFFHGFPRSPEKSTLIYFAFVPARLNIWSFESSEKDKSQMYYREIYLRFVHQTNLRPASLYTSWA